MIQLWVTRNNDSDLKTLRLDLERQIAAEDLAKQLGGIEITKEVDGPWTELGFTSDSDDTMMMFLKELAKRIRVKGLVVDIDDESVADKIESLSYTAALL